jgi:hypothetical protein
MCWNSPKDQSHNTKPTHTKTTFYRQACVLHALTFLYFLFSLNLLLILTCCILVFLLVLTPCRFTASRLTSTHDPDYQPTRSQLRMQRARLDIPSVFMSNQFNWSWSHYTPSLIFSPRHADGHAATLSSRTSILAPGQLLEHDALQLQ